jgi:NAD kinase
MRLLIYGDKNREEIKKLSEKAGFEIVDEDPEIVASCGGDGTLMKAEKEYPNVPKFILHKSKTAKKGHDIPPEEILEKISRGRYKVEEEQNRRKFKKV